MIFLTSGSHPVLYLQACLGHKAKDAPNVVQVTTKGVNDNTITQPIIVLGSGVRQVSKSIF